MEEKIISFDQHKIFYRTAGNGPLVLLIHGFAEDGFVWEKQWQEIKDFKLVIPDLPGSGKSDIQEDMSMEGLATTLKKLLDIEFSNEGIPVVIGHSMGGYIALAFAEKYPVNGLGLFHSTAYADSEEKKETRQKGIRFTEKHGAFEFIKTIVPNLYGPVTRAKDPAIISKHIEKLRNFSAAALVSYYRSMIERPDRTMVIKQIQKPVLFILGRHDSALPVQDGLEQAQIADLSYIHILESSGHLGMIEEGPIANRILTEYLKSLETNHEPR